MKKIPIIFLAITLFSCKDKAEDPKPFVSYSNETHSLYVSAVSHVADGCKITMVSDAEFSGSTLSDSGYVLVSEAQQGRTASIVAFMSETNSVKVYTYSSNKYVYFTSIYDEVKTNNKVVKYNGLVYSR